MKGKVLIYLNVLMLFAILFILLGLFTINKKNKISAFDIDENFAYNAVPWATLLIDKSRANYLLTYDLGTGWKNEKGGYCSNDRVTVKTDIDCSDIGKKLKHKCSKIDNDIVCKYVLE